MVILVATPMAIPMAIQPMDEPMDELIHTEILPARPLVLIEMSCPGWPSALAPHGGCRL